MFIVVVILAETKNVETKTGCPASMFSLSSEVFT
jgi:hypothetical protein